MNPEKVIFVWRKDGKIYFRIIPTARIMSDFDEFVKGYPGNNEVSLQIVGKAYLCSEMYIDWDSEQDVKKLFCYMWYKKKIETINIIFHHKLVLGKLESYCVDGREVSYDEAKERFQILKN